MAWSTGFELAILLLGQGMLLQERQLLNSMLSFKEVKTKSRPANRKIER